MNEIEKMYENAGIEQIEGQEWVCKNPCHCTYQNLSIVPENCSRCKFFQIEMIYPPFTAEKQLKLIDWFIKNEDHIRINYDQVDKLYYIQTYLEETISCKSFAEALANLINIYFEYLTEVEKQQVRGILE